MMVLRATSLTSTLFGIKHNSDRVNALLSRLIVKNAGVHEGSIGSLLDFFLQFPFQDILIVPCKVYSPLFTDGNVL